MNKIKNVLIFLLVSFFVFTVFVFWKIQKEMDLERKIVLAQELRKVVGHLMFDLGKTRENAILDLPADGLWRDHIAFVEGRDNVEYLIKGRYLFLLSNGKVLMVAENIRDFRVRRQRQASAIVEVQIKIQKNVSLLSNLRIRVRP